MSTAVNGIKQWPSKLWAVVRNLPGQIQGVVVILLLISLPISLTSIWIVQHWFADVPNFLTHAPAPGQTVTEVKNIVIGGLQDMKTFDTVSSVDKATVVVHRDNKILWDWIPVGTTDLAYEGVAKIQGGLDIDKISVQRLDSDTIKVTLPTAEITGIYLDVEKSNVIMENRSNFLNPKADAALQSKAQRDALAEVRATACANGLLDRANKNARQFVEQILADAGVEQVEIQVQPATSNTCG